MSGDEEPLKEELTEEQVSSNAPVPLTSAPPELFQGPQPASPISRRESNSIVGVSFQQTSFSGPLPPPDMLAQYEHIYPGAAEFFFDQVAKQSAHRRELETKVVGGNVKVQSAGPVWAGLIVLASIGLCGYMSYLGLGLAAFAPIFLSIAGVASAFITGKVIDKNELKSKRKLLESPPENPQLPPAEEQKQLPAPPMPPMASSNKNKKRKR